MKRILRVTGVVIMIICWHQIIDVAQAQSSIHTQSGHQGKPDIGGDWIVWHDNRRGDDIYDIYAKNLSSGEELQISHFGTAFCPSIHNELVVWQDKRNGDFDIYCYNLVTRTESALYVADGNQVNPSIHDDTVVWRTGQYPHWPQVWGYSITQDTAFRITDAPGNKWEPDVSGNVAVWSDYRNGNWDIYGYNLTTQSEFAIATGPAYQRSVAIYGNIVVYENWRSSENQGVGIYNLITQEHTYHLAPGDCDWLAIYGTIVVWGDYRNEGTDIYGYKILTGEEFPICTEVGWQYCPAIYQGTAVWSDDRDGGFSERDIYSATVPRDVLVDANASGNNDGWTWADAYNYLQDALAVVSSGDNIFVAADTYKPDQGANQTLGDRDATFQLINGVGIYGGFPPGGGQWEDHKPNMYKTKLNGDLNSDDGPDFANNGENSYHVVTTSGTNESAILDGFTITGGNATEHLGGGMRNEDGSPTVSHCTFSGNWALLGGGMYNYESNLTLTNCTFSGNWALFGGGIWNRDGDLTLTNCIFNGNSAEYYGGGMFTGRSTLTNCTFSGNSASEGGGLYDCSGNITNCTITGNRASARGGGASSCSALIAHSTISGNSASDGGGLYNCDGPISNSLIIGNSAQEHGGGLYNCNALISNCIIWNNTAGDQGDQLYQSDAIAYSCVQDISFGQGCISSDPCFMAPGYWQDPCDTPDDPNDDLWVDGDYHLKSQAGRWNLTNQSWIQDEETSPCIDAGDPNSDWTPELWPHGKFINIGVYGGTKEASMSLSNVGNIADLNNDDTVNFGDFPYVSSSWQIEQILLAEDLNRDGYVDMMDVLILCDNWLWQQGEALAVDLMIDNLWMYQNLPGQTGSNLTAIVSIIDDPMSNSSYTYDWEIILPDDVSIEPITVDGGSLGDTFWTFAARGCDEPAGLSDSGQAVTVRVTITGNDYGNTAAAEAEFGIALLGDVNNNGNVNVADLSIINSFWKTGSAGPYSLRDCDVNCNGSVNVADSSITNSVWKGTLGQNSVTTPCPFR